MEHTSCKFLPVLLLVVVTFAQASYYAMPRMSGKRSGYIAFPRLGRSQDGDRPLRSYFALPRMGRSQPMADASDELDCCIGVKTMFPAARELNSGISNCEAACCEGLVEMDVNVSGAGYTLCVPDGANHNSAAGSPGTV